jgi:hypothetical protein
MLYIVEVLESGSETQFADMYGVLKYLPTSLRDEIEARIWFTATSTPERTTRAE